MTTGRLAQLLLAVLVGGTLVSSQAPVAQTLPPWTPGTFDIHHIATGRGNASFLQFPDGTTLLIDAGAVTPPLAWADPLPDGSRSPGAWIADYVRQFAGADARLDYALVTHFHPDHFGDVAPSHPRDAAGHDLNGMTEVISLLHPRVVVDRGWPAYDYPAPLVTAPTANSRVERNAVGNYKALLDDEVRAGRLRVLRAAAGSASQIVATRDPKTWPVEVRVVAVNGDVWTGKGDAAEATFPPVASMAAEDVPDENMCSIALRMRYGKFDYFTGGDLPGDPEGAPAWQGVEQRVGQVIGRTDVHQVNHHGSIDPATPSFLAALQSRVIVIPAWAPTHPSPDALKRILNTRYYPGPRDVFVLALREPMTHAIGARVQQLKSALGHVVVRVEPGGARYRVFVLDARSPSRSVVAQFGPYDAS